MLRCGIDFETSGRCVKFLVVHVFLRPQERVVVDVDSSAERLIDVGNGEQHQSDEQSEGKYLESMGEDEDEGVLREARHRVMFSGRFPSLSNFCRKVG